MYKTPADGEPNSSEQQSVIDEPVEKGKVLSRKRNDTGDRRESEHKIMENESSRCQVKKLVLPGAALASGTRREQSGRRVN